MSQPDAQLFTLDDAARELKRRECAHHGHDFEIIRTVDSDGPRSVICERCGKSWRVVNDD